MHIDSHPVKGHDYYIVAQTIRRGSRVSKRRILYIGRVDNRSPDELRKIEEKLRALDDPKPLRQFRALMEMMGYPRPVVDLNALCVESVLEYGPVLAQHSVWEKLEIPEIIDRIGLRVGGEVPLSKLVEIQVIHRNCEPGSREKTARWYPKTVLPLLLGVPVNKIYSRILLRSLDYLQPKYTTPMQVEIYNNVKEFIGIEPERVDIDITAVHFEGDRCILAEFGYSPPDQRGKKQIVVSVAVDQNGIPLTHIVFPGNRVAKKSLKRIDHILDKEFGVTGGVRVGDRGFATEENIRYMDRKKESYLLALEMNNKEREIASEAIHQDAWTKIDDKVQVTEVLRDENGRKKKYLVGFDKERAEDERKAREGRIKAAEEELARCQRAIARGKIKSRKDRDGRIGNILKNHSVRRYIDYKGNKKGYGFRFWRVTDELQEAERWDGIFVMVTTETHLTAQEILESYRERDRVEKAIRVLKDILEIEPQYVYTKKHVLGHVFICVLAYQIRSVMRYMLKRDGIDMSIDEAFEVLERLKVVNITIHGDKTKVYRKLTARDGDIMTLVETFKIQDEDMGLLPR